MKLSLSSGIFALLAIGPATASPLPTDDTPIVESGLVERAPGDWQCGNQQFPHPVARVNRAYTELENRWASGPYITGANGRDYPAYFGNRQTTPVTFENPSCNNNPQLIDYREFPILRSGKPFTANAGPGPDRVVIGRIGTGGNTIRCGLMTHSGAPNNDFVACTKL